MRIQEQVLFRVEGGRMWHVLEDGHARCSRGIHRVFVQRPFAQMGEGDLYSLCRNCLAARGDDHLDKEMARLDYIDERRAANAFVRPPCPYCEKRRRDGDKPVLLSFWRSRQKWVCINCRKVFDTQFKQTGHLRT